MRAEFGDDCWECSWVWERREEGEEFAFALIVLRLSFVGSGLGRLWEEEVTIVLFLVRWI